ncbi:FAD-binding oxidoreductase [Coxiella burnetii]|nr:FAD-binding oxidoreductase [Coxiella burnetii]ABX78449.1 oxidase, FAD-binding [Coxiella burnetii RSA 331]AML48145.1 FAD-binding protein [Coxiella burnetii]AML54164.1 FAD-binding protein [Coxiella burnetii]ATN68127.1 FAD-binding protein [Coxiella burnetii]ATN70056.1 FAD-binding protein [Coxiella burnetii]
MVMKWWGWGAPDKQPDIHRMPKFLPYVEKILGCNIAQQDLPIEFEKIQLPSPIHCQAFLQQLECDFRSDQISQDKLERLRHTYGKSFRDLFRIRQGLISRPPDYVVYPETTEQVASLLSLATNHNVCVIPFGGGTNIVGAVEASANERRTVVSCDLSRMSRVISIDNYSRTAIIQAGALGPLLESQLNEKGFSLGHFPDSFQFSTLGGWLATRSVGMQSDQYGTISDMVLSLQVVTLQGVIENITVPHASCGPNLRELFIGCEGRLGIITQATMKVYPLPEKEHFNAILFPNFSAGLKAIHRCATQKQLPHMMRLMDNDETDLSFHLKPKESRLKSWLQSGVKSYLRRFKNIKEKQCVCMILAFSGSADEVRRKKKTVFAICRSMGGVVVGQGAGKAWYARKYDYPYLRDFIMDLGCVVDVAETATTWSNVENLYHQVKKVGYQALSECTPRAVQNKIGRPGYVGCHISHNYYNGACLYFTFGFFSEKNHALTHYWQVKKAFTQAIMDHGGALSHHHSIGYEHEPWLEAFIGTIGIKSLAAVKNSLDPTQILNPAIELVADSK